MAPPERAVPTPNSLHLKTRTSDKSRPRRSQFTTFLHPGFDDFQNRQNPRENHPPLAYSIMKTLDHSQSAKKPPYPLQGPNHP
jgi:hypothetical protein